MDLDVLALLLFDNQVKEDSARVINQLHQLVASSSNTNEQMRLVQEQILRLQRVLDATQIKFTLGSATLVELNQQETRLLKVQQKALQKQLDLLLLETAVAVETGEIVL